MLKRLRFFEAKPQTILNFLMRLRLAFSRFLSTKTQTDRREVSDSDLDGKFFFRFPVNRDFSTNTK